MRRALVWLRRDLRTRDHVAWAAATEMANEVAVVFVFDTTILDALPDGDDRRVTFLFDSLAEIDGRLREHGSALLVRHGDPVEIIPRLTDELEVDGVFTNGDFDPYALRRDAAIGRQLLSDGRSFRTYRDHVLFGPSEIVSPEGIPYTTHRLYSEVALARLDPDRHLARHDPDLDRSLAIEGLSSHLHPISLENLGFQRTPLWLAPGESAGEDRLDRFLTERLSGYADARHVPAVPGVSGLSVHLRHGTVSIREAVRRVLPHVRPDRVRDGGEKFLKELIWREYYHMLLARFPRFADEPLDPAFWHLELSGTDDEYAAWERAETGFPIVDAGMRQLATTGYMHNRVRMIVASFLAHDLSLDYRRGEAHFARYLLDYDLASNFGGWQWAAGVGADRTEHVTVLNPVAQARKFDPDGDYIRAWLPELAALDATSLHAPWEAPLALAGYGIVLGRDYPLPLVDHEERRSRAVARLLAARRLADADPDAWRRVQS